MTTGHRPAILQGTQCQVSHGLTVPPAPSALSRDIALATRVAFDLNSCSDIWHPSAAMTSLLPRIGVYGSRMPR